MENRMELKNRFPIVIEFEGFKLSQNHLYLIKELAYVNTFTGESMSYFFKPKKDIKVSTNVDEKLMNWIRDNYHGIDYNYGNVCFSEINHIFNMLSVSSRIVFLIKGQEKCDLLSFLTGRKFVNLEKLDCPVFEHLPYPQIYCGLSQHKDNNFCPLKKAKAYSNWYNETNQ